MEADNGRRHEAFDVSEGIRHNIEYTLGQLRDPDLPYENKADCAHVSDQVLKQGHRVRLAPSAEIDPKASNGNDIFSQGKLRLGAFDCRPDSQDIVLICFPDNDREQIRELFVDQLPLGVEVEVEEQIVVSASQKFRDRYSGLSR